MWRVAIIVDRRSLRTQTRETERSDLMRQLMSARRSVRAAKMAEDPKDEAAAYRAVDQAKRALGERGPVW